MEELQQELKDLPTISKREKIKLHLWLMGKMIKAHGRAITLRFCPRCGLVQQNEYRNCPYCQYNVIHP